MLIDTYLKNSLIPKRYQGEIKLEVPIKDSEAYTYLKYTQDNIKDFVDHGSNILICSNGCGNGKTSWSIKLLKSYIESVANLSFKDNCPALFINVNNFLNEKKLSINDKAMADRINQIEKNILSAKLVVFDDIADKTLSEYDLTLLYYWIDYRTANMKSCIYTSNQTTEQLKQSLSGKIYSRVVKYSEAIELKGGDRRGSTSITGDSISQ